jgi:hypothetical protein
LILVTLIRVQGSSYRQPGARLVVFKPKFQIVLDSIVLINKWIAKKSITGYWVRGE